MMIPVTLRMTEVQHAQIRGHLFPGDDLEAVAILLCGRRTGVRRHILTVREVILIPYDHCDREPDLLKWRTDILDVVLSEAAQNGWAIVKIHSHPGGFDRFSSQDDQADRDLFTSLYGWFDDENPHGSAIMLSDGFIFGRVVNSLGKFQPFDSVSVVGDDLYFWRPAAEGEVATVPAFAVRTAQAFGNGTVELLSCLEVGVVGCSGTGSPLIEQLARLGVGRLTIVDPDRVEEKNLNRIYNATADDARENRLKVDVLARAIAAMELGTEVVAVADLVTSRDVAEALAECDIIFGCVDSIEGRHVLNRLATFYLIPYFDVGIALRADGSGGVSEMCGTVHYLKPGGSSLMSRGVYDAISLGEEALRRMAPEEYEKRLHEKYVRGTQVDRPAVISINSFFASLAVNELLARLHKFRMDGNGRFAQHVHSFIHGETYQEDDGAACPALARHVGKGDVVPFLGQPMFEALS